MKKDKSKRLKKTTCPKVPHRHDWINGKRGPAY